MIVLDHNVCVVILEITLIIAMVYNIYNTIFNEEVQVRVGSFLIVIWLFIVIWALASIGGLSFK